ncbi:hypothetical protein LQK93_00415 [Terrabacter sp. BE26]
MSLQPKAAQPAEPWRGLAQAISADRVLLGPEGAALVLSLMAAAERVARRDGISMSPQLQRLRDVLRVVAMAANGQADVRTVPELGPLKSGEVGLSEASRLLGRSPRQTRRLAASGSLGAARRVGKTWLVSRAEVIAYAAQREAEE